MPMKYTIISLLLLLALPAAAQVPETTAEPAPDLGLVFYENSVQGYSGLVPSNWRAFGNNAYYRRAERTDLTGTLVFVGQGMTPQDLIQPWLLRTGITDLGESSGNVRAQHVTWELYNEVVIVQDVGAAVFDVALAQQGGRSFALVMQTRLQERDALLDALFLPMLFYFAPETGLYDAEIRVTPPPEATPRPPDTPFTDPDSGLSLLIPPGWALEAGNRYTLLRHEASDLRVFFMQRDGDDPEIAIEVALRLIDPAFNLASRVTLPETPPAGATARISRLYTADYEHIITATAWQTDDAIWVMSTQGGYRATNAYLNDIERMEASFEGRTLAAD